MLVSGFSRQGKWRALLLAVIFLGLLVAYAFGLAKGMRDGGFRSPMFLICAPLAIWLAYIGLRLVLQVLLDGRALYVEDGKLHTFAPMPRAVSLPDIKGVEMTEVVQRKRSYPMLRLHLASGGHHDISPRFLDVDADEVRRRILAQRTY